MKQVSLLLLSLLTFIFANAQQETKAKLFNKEKRITQHEVPYTPEIVEKAIADSMAKMGIVGSKYKGYQLYRNVPVEGKAADLYVKVDRKSKKDNSSVITVYAVEPNAHPVESDSDDDKINASMVLLGGLIPAFELTHHSNNIQQKEKSIADINKKLQRLQDDQQDLEKKIKSFQDRLQKNKKEQSAMKAEIQKEQTTLEAMKARKF